MKRIHTNMPQTPSGARLPCSERLDLLRNRVSLLDGQDKAIMTTYLERGNSMCQIAQLAGVTESCIARRIRKLTDRLVDGLYVACLRNRRRFTRLEMTIARDYFLAGLSIREIAAKRRSTYYRIRKTLIRIRQILETPGLQTSSRGLGNSAQTDRNLRSVNTSLHT